MPVPLVLRRPSVRMAIRWTPSFMSARSSVSASRHAPCVSAVAIATLDSCIRTVIVQQASGRADLQLEQWQLFEKHQGHFDWRQFMLNLARKDVSPSISLLRQSWH